MAWVENELLVWFSLLCFQEANQKVNQKVHEFIFISIVCSYWEFFFFVFMVQL